MIYVVDCNIANLRIIWVKSIAHETRPSATFLYDVLNMLFIIFPPFLRHLSEIVSSSATSAGDKRQKRDPNVSET